MSMQNFDVYHVFDKGRAWFVFHLVREFNFKHSVFYVCVQMFQKYFEAYLQVMAAKKIKVALERKNTPSPF